MDIEVLTGSTRSHVVNRENIGKSIHTEVLESFLRLKRDAKKQGIDLSILSGYRSFEEQCELWNRKVRGESNIIDQNGEIWDRSHVSDKEVYQAIIQWVAIPGSSRHHWGTDIDVYDANAKPENYEIQLLNSEYEKGGVFTKLSSWLTQVMQEGGSYGFQRPYDIDRGGVGQELWHISYLPVAKKYFKEFTIESFTEKIESSEVLLKELILENIDAYFEKYVKNINPECW